MSWSAILVAVALPLAAPVGAAPVPKVPKPADDPVPYRTARILKYRKVQKELGLTAEQRINLHDALEDLTEEHERRVAALDKMPNAADDAFDKLDEAHTAAIEKLYCSTADRVLSVAQRARLRQLDLRLRGPGAFADEAVQKVLRLTDAQRDEAGEFVASAAGHAERYLDAVGDQKEDKARAELLAFRADAVKAFVGKFTADQRDMWKTMLGDAPKCFDPEEVTLAVLQDAGFEP